MSLPDFKFTTNRFKKYDNLLFTDNEGNLIDSLPLNKEYNKEDYTSYLQFLDKIFTTTEKNFFKKNITKPEIELEEYLENINKKVNKYSIFKNIPIYENSKDKSAHCESSSLVKPILLIDNTFLIISSESHSYHESRDGVELENSSFSSLKIYNINTSFSLTFYNRPKIIGTNFLEITSFFHIEFYNFFNEIFISKVLFEKYLVILKTDADVMRRIFEYPKIQLNDNKIVTIVDSSSRNFIELNYIEFLSFIFENLIKNEEFKEYREKFIDEFKLSFYSRFDKFR